MGTTERYVHQRAIEEIIETIPHRLKMIDAEHDPGGDRENASQYADAMTSLVFDAIESAIFWTDQSEDLEAFRGKVQDAIDSLDVAIAVWKRSEENGTEPNRRITRQHH